MDENKSKVAVLLLMCLCIFYGCDDVTEPQAEITETEEETYQFGLTEKELKAIEDIISKPYSNGKPYTLNDVAEITCLGYDTMYQDGEWVENKHMIEYKVVFKDGVTNSIAINTILLED